MRTVGFISWLWTNGGSGFQLLGVMGRQGFISRLQQ